MYYTINLLIILILKINIKNDWSSIVNDNEQNNFILTTINSKFEFAPRGYGKSSFRFFEILKLGTIPIYVWTRKKYFYG